MLFQKITGFVALTIVLGVVMSAQASQFDPLEDIYKSSSVVSVPPTAAAPVIDGKISEAEWDCASAYTGFHGYNEQMVLPDSPTVFITYDSKGLYLLCLVPEEQGRPLVAKETQRDGGVYRDDSVEIYFHAKKQDLFQVIINPLGTVADLRNGNLDWSGEYAVAPGRISGGQLPANWGMSVGDYWFVEVGVPFSTLEVDSPKPGDRWACNVAANRAGPWAMLAPCKSKVFADTKCFFEMAYLDKGDPYAQVTSFGNVRFGEVRVAGKLFNPGAVELAMAVDVDLRKEGSYLTHDAYRNIIGVISSVTEPYKVSPSSSIPIAVSNKVTDTSVNLIGVRVGVVKQPAEAMKELVVSRGPVKIEPPLVLKIGNVPSRKYVVLGVDTSGLQSRVSKPKISLKIEVVGSDGRVRLAKDYAVPVGVSETRLDYADMPVGDYICKVSALTGEQMLAQSEVGFSSVVKPKWLTSTIYDDYGKLDRVPLPWRPVEASGRSVSVWGRSMTWNQSSILPASIKSQGIELLRGPMRLVATIDGKDYAIPLDRYKVTETKKMAATVSASGSINGLAVDADIRVEYDGFAWMKLDVKDSVKGRKVSALRVVSEMDTAQTPLYQSHSNAMTGYIEDKPIEFSWLAKSSESIVNFYHWFGNEDRGLGFTYSTMEHWLPKARENFATLHPGEELRSYRINLVERPASLDGRSFVFGVQATPIKPLPPDYHALMAGSIQNHAPWKAPSNIPENYDIWLPWPEPTSKIMFGLNNPYNVDEKLMAEVVKYAHDNNVAVTTVASCPQKVSPNDEHFEDYIMEWKVLPESVLNWNGTTQVQNCGRSYTLRKWLFYGWAIENVKKFGTDGIYYDGWQAGSIACANPHHGCGWVDEQGNRQVVVPIIEGREFNHRMCLFLEDHVDSPYHKAQTAPERPGFPNYHYWIHSWCFAPSVMGFATEWLTGEFTGWPQKGPSMLTPEGTYGKCSGLGEFRTRAISTNWGVPNMFDALMWEHEENSPDNQTLNAFAWFLPHGVSFGITEYVNQKTLIEITRLMMDFEVRKSVFIPGWRPNPHARIVSPIAREVMVATWEHPSKNKVLAVVSNLKVEEAHDVALRWIGFASPKLKNARTGEPLSLHNGVLNVRLGPESFILIEISR